MSELRAEELLSYDEDKGYVFNDITVSKDMEVSWNEDEDKKPVRLTFTLTGVMLVELISWAVADRVIAVQRAFRGIKPRQAYVAFMEGLFNGGTIGLYAVHARNAGKKPKAPLTAAEIGELIASGKMDRTEKEELYELLREDLEASLEEGVEEGSEELEEFIDVPGPATS